MTNHFQKFAFSLISTRPHDTDTVAFSNLSTLESVFKSLRFHRKRYIIVIVFVWTGHENATKGLIENASVWTSYAVTEIYVAETKDKITEQRNTNERENTARKH